MKCILIPLILSVIYFQSFGQVEPVDVAQLTLKVGAGKTEELYYGFAAGDQIIFSFGEMKGKPLKEIIITELPTSQKFMDYKTSSIVDQKIKVYKASVYKFSFRNSAMMARICKVKIQRIPKTEDLVDFNTDWDWKTLYDTTYVPYTQDSIVGYDTTYFTIIKKRLIKDELVLVDVLTNHSIKIHSRYYKYDMFKNNKGEFNEEVVTVSLPATVNTKYLKKENVVWYYGVGINQGQKKEAEKTKKNILNAAGSISTLLGHPEMKVAFSLIDKATSNNSKLSIETSLLGDYTNVQLFKNDLSYRYIRYDNIVASQSIRMDQPLRGTVYLGLQNENGTTMVSGGLNSVTAFVNVSVWTRVREYEDYDVEKQKITARKVTLNKRRMVVKTTEVRVNAK